MGPVIHHGSEELKRRTLPATATGELHVSFGVTEDDAGTDTSRIRTFAREYGDVFIIKREEGVEHQGTTSPEDPTLGANDTA